MSRKEALLPKSALKSSAKRSTFARVSVKLSAFYGADEYLQELESKHEHDHEIASMYAIHADGQQADKSHTKENAGKMLTIQTNDENRSHKTGRLFPTPNLPDPMPEDLAFLFTKMSAEEMWYMWSVLTLIFFAQCLMVIAYAAALYFLPQTYSTPVTVLFFASFIYMSIQHIYVDHDVMHGATFPPFKWQQYLTHPLADFISLPWEEFILEHQRHHASTVDLLIQGEFGWDPEEFQYWLQQWSDKWYCLMLTVPLIPVFHFFGLNDTGMLFAFEWWFHFPDEANGGKCNKEFWSKWFPRRVKHNFFVWCVWACVWLIGTIPNGFDLTQGWRFVLPVTIAARCGYGLAWMLITNFNHSLPWNHFLAADPDRTWPVLHNIMALALGGRKRWNEMLFHDVHHAWPNKVGTMSFRGRFHGWEKVHDACVEVLHRGLWVDKGDKATKMEQMQKRRSVVIKKNKRSSLVNLDSVKDITKVWQGA
mmetsp:Transcript_168129/g.297874  ORF Transcript_168129/g.297874 Transcript_168129/m.297874 type:complete len:479 (+) Transcript_168129:75-1511(+)